ncbi:polysaccharide biosynthesis/export family protein [Bergeyella porcorum]|uniref:polysaccharide biosynthesis/export family protein n=1 Tax=Bergeyella porcorum TaxID=1735111 RepID=UPI0035E67F05
MKHLKFIYFLSVLSILTSCLTSKEVRYLQPSESLVINEEGLVPYNQEEYRVTKNDIFNLNIITTPKGDAAQFYSSYNATGGETATGAGRNSNAAGGGGNTGANAGSGGLAMVSGNLNFYFNGIRVDAKGDINVFGVGYIKAEGRTINEIQNEIQEHVNTNFLEGKSEVRLNLDGINYYILGDIETTEMTGAKKSYTNSLNIMEAIAQNGGLNRTVDRKNVILQRRYPEGIKTVRLDLTREDIMNSQYYWIQNGDLIYLNTRAKSFNGFGKDPVQTITSSVTLLTTALSIYLLITRL